MANVLFMYGKNLLYGFPNHPLSKERLQKAFKLMKERGIFERKKITLRETKIMDENILFLFHTKEHIEYVKKMSSIGHGYLDYGDTPAYAEVFEVSLASVSATLQAVEAVWNDEFKQAFNIAGGYHHAFPDRSAGFCVFNDVGIAINFLKKNGVKRILYVDIDAHHGDGVFYSFYSDPSVWIADVHQFPLFPYTGMGNETGSGEAKGTKINFPLSPGAGDKELLEAMKKVFEFGKKAKPEIIIMQAGCDGIRGDMLTELNYSLEGHLEAFKYVYRLAEEMCEGRLLITGGGGYNISNVSNAWTNILDFLTKE